MKELFDQLSAQYNEFEKSIKTSWALISEAK